MIIVFGLLVAIGIFGVSYTTKAAVQQKRKSDDLGENRAKYKVSLNPILWSYIIALLAVIVGAIIYYLVVFA